MKKYLINRKTSEIKCDHCGQLCKKPNSEIKRSTKLERKLFCSRSCSIKAANIKHLEAIKERFQKHRQIGSKTDKYSPFRSYLRIIQKRYKDWDIDLQYLFELWNIQKGICPYTNFSMHLRIHSTRHKINNIDLYQASLDRIDSSKGYIKGNIEFVCLGINYMKSTFSKEQVQNFLSKLKFP